MDGGYVEEGQGNGYDYEVEAWGKGEVCEDGGGEEEGGCSDGEEGEVKEEGEG